MHLHNFNICSLMRLSFCTISNGSQWTGPRSLLTNKCTHIATGTYNFIFYQSLLQYASYLWLTVFKTVTMPCQTTQQNFTFLGLVSAILNWGDMHITTGQTWTPQKYTQHIICILLHPSQKDLKIPLHLHSMFLHNSSLKHCHKFLFYASYNKPDTLLCHVAHISDNMHDN